MRRLVALFLILVMIPCISFGRCESAGTYADAKLPTEYDYALFGGMWYPYEVETYGVPISAADLGAIGGYFLLNADGTGVFYSEEATVYQLGIPEKTMTLLWRMTADGAILYPTEEWFKSFFTVALQNLPQELDDDMIDEVKKLLKEMLVFRLEALDGDLILSIGLDSFGYSRSSFFENYKLHFRHQPPEEPQPLPAIRPAADESEFYGTWLWDTLALNEKQRLPIRSLYDAVVGSRESAQSGSVTIDESGISGNIVNGKVHNLQFSDGQLSCRLDFQPSIKAISDLLNMDQSALGASYDIDLTVSLCENGSIRIRYESAGWENTVDIYYVRKAAKAD